MDESDVIPFVFAKRSRCLVLGIDVPEHTAFDNRHILQAVLGCGAVGTHADVKHVGRITVFLAKANTWHVFANGLHVKFDGAVVE